MVLTIHKLWMIGTLHQNQLASKRSSSPAHPPLPTSTAASSSQGGHIKCCMTAPARPDPCCPCSINAVCSVRNCPCAIACRPCLNCDPGNDKCRNTMEAVNERIDIHNRCSQRRSSLRQMRAILGMESPPLLRHRRAAHPRERAAQLRAQPARGTDPSAGRRGRPARSRDQGTTESS